MWMHCHSVDGTWELLYRCRRQYCDKLRNNSKRRRLIDVSLRTTVDKRSPYLRVLLGERESRCSRPRCAGNQDYLDRYQADDAARSFAYRHFPSTILVTGFRFVKEALRSVSGAHRLREVNVRRLRFPTSSRRLVLSSGRGGGRHRPWRHR